MKKLLCTLLALTIVVMLAACGGSTSSSAPAAPTPAESTPAESTPEAVPESEASDSGLMVAMLLPGNINDHGWNAEAYLGLTTIESELGAEIAFSEKVDASDYEEVFRGYAELGYDLIIGHGFQFGDAACAVAPNYPDTFFAITSSSIYQEPNVCGLMNRNDQQGFLAGVVAAMETDSGIVGCVGGSEIPSITAYVDGFAMGVKWANPDVKVLSNYTGDFSDAAAAKQLADAMISEGADIITHDADAAGLGIFEAVNAATGVRCIGAVDDQYEQAPDTIITSSMSKLSGAIVLAAQYVQEGTLEPISYYFGIDEGTVYLADFRDYELKEETQAKIDEALAGIADGSIKVDIQGQ